MKLLSAHVRMPRLSRSATVGFLAVVAVAATTFFAPAQANASPGWTQQSSTQQSRKTEAIQRLLHREGTDANAHAAALVRSLSIAIQSARATSHAVVGDTPPTSTPTNLSVAGDSDVVQISADSTAPYVEFQFGQYTVGAPVAVQSGTATADFATWGLANGQYSVTAADCSSTALADCNLNAPASTDATVDNSAPVITQPLDGSQVTGGFTVTATSTGGGVAFLIDGVRRGFDGVAPYRFDYTGSALSTGRHDISAVPCSTDGSLCNGPLSQRISIFSNSLHPRITSLAPRLFSPQRNGVKDATTLRFYVPDREHATIAVTNGRGQAVRRADVGNVGRGSHTWTWNGRTRSGTVVPSGRYRITVNTSRVIRQTLVRGAVWTSATVDDLAPRITRLRAPSTIYPVRDRYKDALVVTGYLGESALIALAVSNTAGRTVKSVPTRHGAGHFSLEWNGRDAAGRIMPGTYRWSLSATDSAGNSRVLRSHRVVVSAKRLVTQHAVVERNGDAFVSAGASDPYCGEASTSLSQWTHGVWLSNACAGESAVVAAFYRVRVPYAVRYTRLGVLAGGSALFIPSSMEAVFGVNGGSQNFGIPGYYELRSRKAAWWVSAACRIPVREPATQRVLRGQRGQHGRSVRLRPRQGAAARHLPGAAVTGAVQLTGTRTASSAVSSRARPS